MAARPDPATPGGSTFGGAVLCGGESRRMGTDKALLRVDGVPMAVRVARALAEAGAGRVVAVGGDAERLTAAGLDAVPDLEPGAGPLGGILTALDALDAEVAFIASCDLVAPSPQAVAATVDALVGAGAVSASGAPDASVGPGVTARPVAVPQVAAPQVAVPLVGGRRQWMHAAWRAGVAAPLRAAFDAGERAVHAACAVAGLPLVEVDVPVAAVADADAPSDLPPPATR